MINIIGKFYQSEIFVYESCIYLDIYEHLLKNHKKVTQIYDEFVSNEDIREEIEKYIKDNINSIKDKYNISITIGGTEFLPDISTFENSDELELIESKKRLDELNNLRSFDFGYKPQIDTTTKDEEYNKVLSYEEKSELYKKLNMYHDLGYISYDDLMNFGNILKIKFQRLKYEQSTTRQEKYVNEITEYLKSKGIL